MFFTLLLVTFLLSVAVSYFVATIFKKPLGEILQRIIKDAISAAWQKYLTFATYVVGVSGGVRIYQLEQYAMPERLAQEGVGLRPVPMAMELNAERWTIEVYRTIIETLQAIAWMYLIVFVFALIAYVIVRGNEMKHGKNAAAREATGGPDEDHDS